MGKWRLKLQCSTEERETTFATSYQEVRKTEGSRVPYSTVVISVKRPRILSDLDRLPSKIKNLLKKQ